MLKNPQDRRAKRTAMQIKEAMLFFMESKSIHEISVSQICKTCQINRATFYDHYRDVFDLVEDMEKDMLLALDDLMERVKPKYNASDQVSRYFFSFLEEYRRPLRLLLVSERSLEFSKRVDSVIMPFFEEKVRQNYVIPEGMSRELKSCLQFVASGYYKFFMQAIISGLKPTVADADIYAQMGDACLSVLFEKK